MWEWSPLLRLISYTFLQQAEGGVDNAGNMIKERGDVTTLAVLRKMVRQSRWYHRRNLGHETMTGLVFGTPRLRRGKQICGDPPQ